MKSNSFFLAILILVGSRLGECQVPHPTHQGSLKGSGAPLFSPNRVCVAGNLAFVISWNDNALVIADISDPQVPAVKSTVQVPTPLSVFVSGNYAYVGNFLGNGYSFITIDITDPSHPVIRGSIQNGDGGAIIHYPTSIFVAGNYAYVTNAGEESLEILNVSDPDQPAHVGKILGSPGGAALGYPAAVVVSGNYAYVASSASNAFEIFDVSNPAAPAFVSRLADGTGGAIINDPFSVFVSGNYAYLTSNSPFANDGKNALEIVDISDPANPVHSGKIIDGDGGAELFYPYSVVVSGAYAYVASQFSNALEIIDVTDPAAPVHKGSLANGSSGALLKSPQSVAISSSNVYVASTGSNALEIIDVADPSTPTHMSSLVDGAGGNGTNLNEASAVFTSGKYAYVATADALEVVDISHPDSPIHAGSILDGTGGAKIDYPTSVFVSGNYAYITNYSSNSLEIVDVTTPGSPLHLGNIADGAGGATLKYPSSVFVAGKYAYVAAQNSAALEIVDVSNPGTPLHAGSINSTPEIFGPVLYALMSPTSVFVSGSYAYVVGSNALEILDITNPILPKHKSSLLDGSSGTILNNPQSIFVKGDYAYIACYSGSLEIINISNPAAPTHVANIADGAGGASLLGAQSVYVSGRYACVASRSTNSLEVIDVSNPSLPVHAGNIVNGTGGALLKDPVSVSFSNYFAYVAGKGSNALEVISVLVPDTPLAMSAGDVTAANFNARWHRATGAIGYQLDVSADNFQSFLPGFSSVTIADTLMNITGLNAGTTYQYRIRAYNASGVSASSNTTSLTTVPPPPNSLTALAIGSSSFRAIWNKSRGASGYQLDVSQDGFQTFLPGFNAKEILDTAISVTNVTSSSSYQYRVRADNAAGVSTNSGVITVFTVPLTPVALPAFMITSNSFRAHWVVTNGANGYQLDVSSDGFATFLPGFNAKVISDTTYDITGLDPGGDSV